MAKVLNIGVEAAHRSAPVKPSAQPLETIDGHTLLNKHFDPVPFIFDDLLYSGMTILGGRPKVGKSWLALQLAIDAALGRPGLAKFGNCTPRRVLYLGLEEGERRTNSRLQKFISRGSDEALLSGNIHFAYKLLPLLGGGIEELDATMTAQNSKFVVIDTLIRALGGRSRDKNADAVQEDYKVVSAIQELAQRHDAAILTVAHTRKMGADYALDKLAGTTGLSAGADAVWILDRGEKCTVLSIQGREMGDVEYAVRLDQEDATFGWAVTGSADDARTSGARWEIMELLEESSEPMMPNEIAKLLNKNRSTVRRLLSEMRKDGKISKCKEGYRLT